MVLRDGCRQYNQRTWRAPILKRFLRTTLTRQGCKAGKSSAPRRWRHYSGVALALVAGPYVCLAFTNAWPVRWACGWSLVVGMPWLVLSSAVDRSIRHTTFEPGTLRGRWRVFRHTEWIVRVLMVFFVIVFAVIGTLPYVMGSARLACSGWRAEQQVGTIHRSAGTPFVIIRYITIQTPRGELRELMLLYPTRAMRHKVGRTYHWALLPKTGFVLGMEPLAGERDERKAVDPNVLPATNCLVGQ